VALFSHLIGAAPRVQETRRVRIPEPIAIFAGYENNLGCGLARKVEWHHSLCVNRATARARIRSLVSHLVFVSARPKMRRPEPEVRVVGPRGRGGAGAAVAPTCRGGLRAKGRGRPWGRYREGARGGVRDSVVGSVDALGSGCGGAGGG
jgi:hypothetical protein